MSDADPALAQNVRSLPNGSYIVATSAGDVLVHSPPETLKVLLSLGLSVPATILLPPDMPAGTQVGSSGFVRQGINYASVEFLLYARFFGAGSLRTHLITVTQDQARRLRRILDETISGPPTIADYGSAPWLRDEAEAISFYPPLGRAPGTDDLATITSLEEGGGNLGDLQIAFDGEDFHFRDAGIAIATVPGESRQSPLPLTVAPLSPAQHQAVTLVFLGGSHGFDPNGITTCFLAYLCRGDRSPAILFDAAAFLRVRLAHLGIAPTQIGAVVLSHLHEDHLAGLPELILMGEQRVRLISATIVYQGLLRVLSAMLAVPEAEVAALFDFYPLDPGQPLLFEGLRYEAIYAVHSIPTIAVRVGVLCYSGDMRYDEAWFDELVRQGALRPDRRAELEKFAEGAEILVQDVGGGNVHSTLNVALIEALLARSKRLVLAHTSQHQLPAGRPDLLGQIEFAGSGHVVIQGDAAPVTEHSERLETLSASPLFARLPLAERRALTHEMQLITWADGQVIFAEGDAEDGRTFVVHGGLVEVLVHDERRLVVGRGSWIGERGVIQNEPRSGTLRARGEVQLLELPHALFVQVAERLDFASAAERADWLWRHPAFTHLPWATLLDLALDFRPRPLATGERLFEYGDIADEAYLLLDGAVEVYDRHGDLQEAISSPDMLIGGRAALNGRIHASSASATSAGQAWSLPAAALQRVYTIYPSLLFHLRVADERGGKAR